MSISGYIERHKLVETINVLVNETASARAENPLAFMADHLVGKTKPTVLEVNPYISMVVVKSQQGQIRRTSSSSIIIPSINVELRTHKGVFHGSGARSNNPSVHQRCPPEHRDGDKREFGGLHVKKALKEMKIKTKTKCPVATTKVVLAPRKLCSQREEDANIRQHYGYVNQRLPLSVAFCKANAREANVSVEEYIRSSIVCGDLPMMMMGGGGGGNDDDPYTTIRLVYELCEIPDMGVVYAVCPPWRVKEEEDEEDTSMMMIIQSMFDTHMFNPQEQEQEQEYNHKNIDNLFDRLSEKGIEFGIKIHTDGTWYDKNRNKLRQIYKEWVKKYESCLLFIEDPFDETENENENNNNNEEDEDEYERRIISSMCVWSRYIASDPSRLGEWIDGARNSNRSNRSNSNISRTTDTTTDGKGNGSSIGSIGGGVCIKLSETGLVTDTVDALCIARDAGIPFIMTSVEEGPYDGNPEMVVDIAIATRVPFIKIGRIDTPQGSSVLNHLLNRKKSYQMK